MLGYGDDINDLRHGLLICFLHIPPYTMRGDVSSNERMPTSPAIIITGIIAVMNHNVRILAAFDFCIESS